MTSDTRDMQTTEQRTSSRVDRVQLSAVQVAASALASVSAAVIASLFGVAGTVVGAGLVAIVSTTGSALYSASMKRTSDQLRRAREQLLTARAGTDGRPRRARSGSTAVLEQAGGGRRGHRDRTIDLTDGADTTSQLRSGQLQADEKPQSWWRRGWLTIGSRKGLKWPALVGAAVLVFAIAIGVITAVEAITQKPISALTGHSTSGTTTVGSLTGNSNSSPTPAPNPTETGSGSDAGTNSPAPRVTVTPTSRTGSGSGGSNETSTSSAQPSPSAAPTSPAPHTTTGTGNGGGTGTGSGNGSDSGSGSGTGGQDIQVPVP